MRQQERIVAEIIRAAGAYRWVGIYEIDRRRQRVVNPAWSGPGAPAHPEFPLSDGLTGRAIAERRSVGDVSRDGSSRFPRHRPGAIPSRPLDRKRRVSSVAASEPQHRLLSIRARRDSRRRETRRNQQGGTRAGATRRKGVPLQHAARRTLLAARLYRQPARVSRRHRHSDCRRPRGCRGGDMRTVVLTPNAPNPLGRYSRGIQGGRVETMRQPVSSSGKNVR